MCHVQAFILLIFLSVTVQKSKLLYLDKSLRNFTLPFLHNSPWQIPFLNWRFRQFNFLYHSSHELCHYNVCLVMSPTSICIFFCQSFMGVSTTEELRHAINACKDLINATSDDSEEKRKLITKLVQLRLKLQETQVCR